MLSISYLLLILEFDVGLLLASPSSALFRLSIVLAQCQTL